MLIAIHAVVFVVLIDLWRRTRNFDIKLTYMVSKDAIEELKK